MSFGHAGILLENSFVMYDRGTDSLWVHVTGRAVWGPLKGEQLEFVPSTENKKKYTPSPTVRFVSYPFPSATFVSVASVAAMRNDWSENDTPSARERLRYTRKSEGIPPEVDVKFTANA